MTPTLLIPDEGRKWLKDQWLSISRSYQQPILRRQAMDHAIAQLKEKYPDAFHKETYVDV